MSEQGKELGKEASKHLSNAEQSLKRAAEYTKQAGDGGTTKQIEKIQKDVSTTRTDLDKKVSGDPKNG